LPGDPDLSVLRLRALASYMPSEGVKVLSTLSKNHAVDYQN